MGAGQFARAAGDAAALRASPELDGDTLALAAGLVDEMQLGRRSRSRPARGQPVRHRLCRPHLRHRRRGDVPPAARARPRDRRFPGVLDSRRINYAVVLTADHGGKDIPERERLAGVTDAARVGSGLGAQASSDRRLVAQLGLTGSRPVRQTWAATSTSTEACPRQDRKRLLDAAVAAYRAQPQVDAVFTAEELAATPIPTGPPDRMDSDQRARASYYPGRSGDFVVLLKKDVTPIPDTTRYVATHGSPWDYDRRVPILFWRPVRVGTTVRHPGRDHRHHADAGGDDRLAGRRQVRSTAGASTALQMWFARTNHLKTRAFLS